jgi:hypothetical protein
VLDGLFVTPAVTAINESLAVLGDRGREVAVVGHAKLATALADKRSVTPVAITGRAAAKLPNTIADTTSLVARSLDAVIAVDIVDDDGWRDTLREWTRITRDGGAIVLVDRGHAAEASRRALCSGLSELEQRHAGKTVITSGLVTHLPDD